MKKSCYVKGVDFEEAITKCGFGKFNYILIVLAGGLMGSSFIELTSVNFILPVAQCDLDMSTSDKGILSSIGYVGVILSSHLWGFLSGLKGRRKSLIASLLVAFVATLVSSFVNSFWLLVFLRFVNGFFISCASSTTFAYLGEFHDARNRGKVLMTASILYSIMMLLLPTFAILTINQEWSLDIDLLEITYKPWRLFLIICSIPNLICALMLIFILPESPKFTHSQGNDEKTLAIFRKMYEMNTGKSAESFEITEIIKNEEFNESNQTKSKGFLAIMLSQSVPLFQGKHLRNMLTACFIQFAACNTINGFWTFLPEIMNKVSLWNQDQNGPATVCEIFNAQAENFHQTLAMPQCIETLEISTFLHVLEIKFAYGFSYAIMSLVINRAGKLFLILVIVFSTGTAAFLLIFINIPTVSLYLYLYLLLAGLVISVVNASTVELFPTNLRAMAVCFSMMVGRIGSVTGSVVIGLFINDHCDLTFLMPICLLVTSGVLAFTIPSISKRIK